VPLLCAPRPARVTGGRFAATSLQRSQWGPSRACFEVRADLRSFVLCCPGRVRKWEQTARPRKKRHGRGLCQLAARACVPARSTSSRACSSFSPLSLWSASFFFCCAALVGSAPCLVSGAPARALAGLGPGSKPFAAAAASALPPPPAAQRAGPRSLQGEPGWPTPRCGGVFKSHRTKRAPVLQRTIAPVIARGLRSAAGSAGHAGLASSPAVAGPRCAAPRLTSPPPLFFQQQGPSARVRAGSRVQAELSLVCLPWTRVFQSMLAQRAHAKSRVDRARSRRHRTPGIRPRPSPPLHSPASARLCGRVQRIAHCR
jgi:hypothetical protein